MHHNNPDAQQRASRRVLLGTSAISLAAAAVTGAMTYNWIFREQGMDGRKVTALRLIAIQAFPEDYDPDDDTFELSDHDFEAISDFYDDARSATDRFVEGGDTDWLQEFKKDGGG